MAYFTKEVNPDNRVYVANMVPTWGRQDPGGPHVGPVNLIIWEPKFNLTPMDEGLAKHCLTSLVKYEIGRTAFHLVMSP